MDTTELGFTVEDSYKSIMPETWALDVEVYDSACSDELLTTYKNLPTRDNAEALTLNRFYAMFKAMRPGAGVVINNSTGKDSTLMLALYFQAALGWRKQGHNVPRTIVAIANTGAEFPRLNSRISNEVQRINKYVKEHSLPVEAICETARPKSRLFAEIIGNGKPLPALVTGKASNGSGEAMTSWCMDRVKKGPLDAINKHIAKEVPYYISLIGVRLDESSKRRTTIEKCSAGLPLGLTRIDGLVDEEKEIFNDKARLGMSPIVDWSTELVEDFLRCDEIPWNVASPFELGKIYYSASKAGDQKATQCDLTLTKEGQISNKCEGLDGARLGCWCCVKSVNKSLTYMHQNDSRELKKAGKSTAHASHRWLRGFHKYLIGLHKRYHNASSAKPVHGRIFGKKVKVQSIVSAMGKNTQSLFAKNYSFEERARLLLLLFRAEIESGFKLIEEEEIDMIALFWKKCGYWHIDPRTIRKDAKRWKETGKPELSYMKHIGFADRSDIAHGLPAAAYFHSEPEAIELNMKPLKLLHLLALRSHGTPLLPTPRAYVFHRRERENNEQLVMVTDMPSVIGAKTGTNLLNGICPFAWVLRGTRELTDWEYQMFKTSGRNFFYSHLAEETSEAVQSYLNAESISEDNSLSYRDLRRQGKVSARHSFFPHRGVIRLAYTNMRDTVLKNISAVRECGFDADVLGDHWTITETIPDLRGSVTAKDLDHFQEIIGELADHCDILEDESNQLAYDLEKMVGNKWHLLESPELKQTEEMKNFQAGLTDIAKRNFIVPRTRERFERSQQLLAQVFEHIEAGKLNWALVNRIAYISRTMRYDPEYGVKLSYELMKLLRLVPLTGGKGRLLDAA